MNKNKIILAAFLILGLIGAVTVYNNYKKLSTIDFVDNNQIVDLIYSNQIYGFSLKLPASWSGYVSTTSAIQYGYMVTLIHPSSTEDNKRMNIPILIYTQSQWQTWTDNNFEGYPTAAPIGPTLRASTSEYVFATAPRYNFSFLTGFEEVENIINNIKVTK